MKTHLTTFLITLCLGSSLLLPQASRAQTPVPPEPKPSNADPASAGFTGIVAVAAPDKQSEEQYLQARLHAFDNQRPAAAQAVFRLGECYRRLKRYEEARIQYARILREFTDSPDLVAQSARLLLELGKYADPTAGASANPAARVPVLSDLPVLGNVFTVQPKAPTEKTAPIGIETAPPKPEALPVPSFTPPKDAPANASPKPEGDQPRPEPPAKEAAPSPSDAAPVRPCR